MEQNEWLDNFYNKDSLSITKEIETLMNKNKFINNIDVKIEEMEVDFLSKMNEIKNTFDKEDINKIYNSKNSLEILQKELEIVKLISKYSLQNNKLEFIFIITCLKYLHKLSEILRIRLKQLPINMNKGFNKNINISRCSYKFCNYKEECTYNYNFGKKTNQCYQDHYVHNMVSHDVDSLISYIESNYKNDSTISHNKEILKTINTLSFVIGHMEGELRAKCLYNDPKDCEKFHYINILNK
jgi:hypothetical protein